MVACCVCLQCARQLDRNAVWSRILGLECCVLSWQRSLCLMVLSVTRWFTFCLLSLYVYVSWCFLCFCIRTAYCWVITVLVAGEFGSYLGMWQSSNSTTFELRTFLADSKFDELFSRPIVEVESQVYRRRMFTQTDHRNKLTTNARCLIVWKDRK